MVVAACKLVCMPGVATVTTFDFISEIFFAIAFLTYYCNCFFIYSFNLGGGCFEGGVNSNNQQGVRSGNGKVEITFHSNKRIAL